MFSVSDDFIVNSTTASDQVDPDVVALPDGRLMFLWTSNEGGQFDIRARFFGADGSPEGADFIVNTTTTGTQAEVAATVLVDGRVFVSWHSDAEIHGRIYGSAGNPLTGEFSVSTTFSPDEQRGVEVAALSGGGFVAAWWFGSSGSDVRARVFDANGVALGDDFMVNTSTPGDQRGVGVAALDQDRFVVTYNNFNGSQEGILARLFDAGGVPVGNDFLVNTTTGGEIRSTSVKTLSDGRFVVAWQQSNSDADDVRGRIFDAHGVAEGGDFLINSTTAGSQSGARMTALPDGGFFVAFSSTEGGDYDIRGRAFNAAGSPLGDDFIINSTLTGDQFVTGVAVSPDGDIVVTWQSSDSGDGSGTVIRAGFVETAAPNAPPVITSNGGDASATVTVPENTTAVTVVTAADPNGDPLHYSIAGGADAIRFTIDADTGHLAFVSAPDFETPTDLGANNVYDVTVQATDSFGASDTQAIAVTVSNIVGQTITGTNQSDVLNGTGEEDSISGLANNDTLNGFAGNDFLDGGAGADTMRGGVGNDTYVVDSASDVVIEALNQGTDTVRASVTYTLTANVENLTLTGNGNIGATGNGLANVIIGNAGANKIAGLGGADLLTGGQGADRFIYSDPSESTLTSRDVIADFQHGIDVLDVSAVDARTSSPGNQTFQYAGQNTAVVQNSISWFESGGSTIVQADVNGDTTADLVVQLSGTHLQLTPSDFIL